MWNIFQPSSSLRSHELSGLTAFQGSGSVTVDMLSFIHRADARTDRGWRVFQPVKCASAAFVYYAHKVQPYMRGQRLLVKNKMAMQSFAKRNISRQKACTSLRSILLFMADPSFLSSTWFVSETLCCVL